jgi:hypothetical protein
LTKATTDTAPDDMASGRGRQFAEPDIPKLPHETSWRRFFIPNRDVNYSARLFQSHYENPWDSEREEGVRPQRWFDTIGGRVAIRTFSRGVMGAGFMTLGQVASRGYNPHLSVAEHENIIHKFMSSIAWLFDHTLGKGIEKSVGALYGEEIGHQAVRFRTKNAFGHPEQGMGRSFGNEVVGVTFDFALGSIGDAWGRRIAGLFDPNVRKKWMKEGHLDIKELGKDTVKTAWEILSYNQAEDWAAAPLYVYQMKGQRHLLDGMWKGARISGDHNVNSSIRVNDHGIPDGDFLKAGALDFQMRFMGYNFYTLMYRDIYNHMRNHISHWNEYKGLDYSSHPDRSLVGEVTKYIGKSFTKSMLYMAPAVFPFWTARVAGGLNNGSMINPDKGPIMARYTDKNNNVVETPYSSFLREKDGLELTLGGKQIKPGNQEHYLTTKSPFEWEYNRDGFSRAMNNYGEFIDKVGSGVQKEVVEPAMKLPGLSRLAAKNDALAASFAHAYTQNAMSYTPYMIAKYETQQLVDTPVFDAAFYRFADGLDHLRFSEVKAGIQDMFNATLRKPVSEQTEAQAHEPRGLVNSTKESQDYAAIRRGYKNSTHAHEIRKAYLSDEPEEKIHKEADSNETAKADRDVSPEKRIALREEGNNVPTYQVSRLDQQRSVPPGVTIH